MFSRRWRTTSINSFWYTSDLSTLSRVTDLQQVHGKYRLVLLTLASAPVLALASHAALATETGAEVASHFQLRETGADASP